MDRFDGFPHVMRSQQFSRKWLEEKLFPLTDNMEKIFKHRGCDILKGKTMVCLFWEPSTRTRMSFEFAIDYLGGKVVFSTENARQFSSGAKGETLAHTLEVINRYRPDVIVLRYDRDIGSEIAMDISKTPVINGGDRNPGQHPTQGLLDLFTIKKRFGTVDGLTISMVGDLTNGRTVRSLCYLLGKFNGVSINLVSPDNARMKDDVKEYLEKHEIAFKELSDLRQVAATSDVVYQTRTQKECGSSIDRQDFSNGYFIVNKEIVDMTRQNAIIMHPLPIDGEITSEVDNHQKAVYLTDQVDNGLFVRMALLKMILDPDS